ncbi:VWA domain-containing protein [Caldovatus sediminis]|uniref:VWA domain-containing protein n=1 Tax=Caldovatus sediminis TaxID=2041189 RepID=A0A8J2ZD88_9PROT|nr:VWA domain-containing protein [Caldovatus sediminis]GGG39735.1 VWA domain-containing protein [Caldovatus sediminis]
MFATFILALRQAGLPVSLTEYLTLLGAMKARVAAYDLDDFYYLSRAALVKDERHLDRFDRIFGEVFRGLERPPGAPEGEIPEEWLRLVAEKVLTPEEMARIEALGGFEALMETLRRRLAEQEGRHQGGSKWIGTGGTSPFGAYGYNPEGVRIGQDGSRHRRAVKVWDRREFRDLDDDVEIGTRNMKIALRRLRRFAREGAATELDMPGTIRSTAHNAGTLDLRLVPERRNAVKVLLLLDIGGSMDDHVRISSELFSAARSEFKHLVHFYFHNCPYERLWRSNRRRRDETVPTAEVLRTYGPDYKLVIVGDASMSPYEITQVGGSVEHWNEESGRAWLERLTGHFRRSAWLNPVPQDFWGHTRSIGMVGEIMEGRMFPLTLRGLDDMARELVR